MMEHTVMSLDFLVIFRSYCFMLTPSLLKFSQ